jgi:DNA-binding response OmpR family regulator
MDSFPHGHFSDLGILFLQAADTNIHSDALDGASEPHQTQKHGSRVLVIDDERLVADSLTMILKHFNYDAAPFYNGETAIAAARERCPDFVISDVVMPTLNGVETVLKIREICPDARVILLSGNAATADLLKEAHSEGHDFELLAKPVPPNELLRRLR